MDQSLILALDIGTSSIRGALYDIKAEPIADTAYRLDRSLDITPEGGAEIDADEAVEQVAAVIDGVLERSKEVRGDIISIASCSFWHSLVGVDKTRKPTTKVLGWADTRSSVCVNLLRNALDEDEVHNRTGAHIHSSYWPAKLSWLSREFPDMFVGTLQWLSFSDYLALKLSGNAVTSVSMASGTGIFDIRKCRWDTELLDHLNIKPENLPMIAEGSLENFKLEPEFVERWQRLKDSVWLPAIGDGAADNIGSGCTTSTEAALMIGTSSAIRVAYRGEPPERIPRGLWCYRIDRERVIIGGALSDGGGLYEWIKKTFNLPHDAEERISSRKLGEHGLVFLPYIAGERSPGYNPYARGGIFNLTSTTEAIDILQSAFEAVGYKFRELFELLSTVVTVKKIVASGGALRESPAWKGIIEDILSFDLMLSGIEEPSSRGAVLHAMDYIGRDRNIERFELK